MLLFKLRLQAGHYCWLQHFTSIFQKQERFRNDPAPSEAHRWSMSSAFNKVLSNTAVHSHFKSALPLSRRECALSWVFAWYIIPCDEVLMRVYAVIGAPVLLGQRSKRRRLLSMILGTVLLGFVIQNVKMFWRLLYNAAVSKLFYKRHKRDISFTVHVQYFKKYSIQWNDIFRSLRISILCLKGGQRLMFSIIPGFTSTNTKTC